MLVDTRSSSLRGQTLPLPTRTLHQLHGDTLNLSELDSKAVLRRLAQNCCLCNLTEVCADGTTSQVRTSTQRIALLTRHTGLRAILSGPAGGVVGYSKTCYDDELGSPLIAVDMGGTSTDVSRYAGKLEHVFETTTAEGGSRNRVARPHAAATLTDFASSYHSSTSAGY